MHPEVFVLFFILESRPRVWSGSHPIHGERGQDPIAQVKVDSLTKAYRLGMLETEISWEEWFYTMCLQYTFKEAAWQNGIN